MMIEPTFDANGYPTDETLDRIKAWPIIGSADCEALLAFVEQAWHFAEWGYRRAPRRHRQYGMAKMPLVRRYEISTGGWSGNEDIMSALQTNWMFWALAWASSRRGGHYVFEVAA